MPIYSPLRFRQLIDPLKAEFRVIKWKSGVLAIDVAAANGSLVRLTFKGVIAHRLLDGLSIAADDGNEQVSGLTKDALAYMVEGSQFWEAHAALLKKKPNAKHYRVLTVASSIDVISEVAPALKKVPPPPPKEAPADNKPGSPDAPTS